MSFREKRLQVKTVQILQQILQSKPKITFLTGAGVSTDSGIPDYRGPNGVYVRNANFKPITFQQFVGDSKQRQRYWARSFLGWPTIANAAPNQTHQVISNFQTKNPETKIITQNVDGLFEKAGAKSIEMHGSLHVVKCLGCKTEICRKYFQEYLSSCNPGFTAFDHVVDVASSTNPDGDKEVHNIEDFHVPDCKTCGSILKPNVIFFGENMSQQTRIETFDAIDKSDLLITMGTSLTVYSAIRLVKHANQIDIPVVIINVGETRGDSLCDLKIDSPISTVLPLFEASN